jgi:predicted homoserine dehydrogenase-like protein
MIIVDRELEKRETQGRPIRVAMVGSGFMGRGIARQILRYTKGMDLVGIVNRTPERAIEAFKDAGEEKPVFADSAVFAEACISAGRRVIAQDSSVLCRAGNIDALIEVTGTVEEAARTILEALAYGKHVVMMNAELDGTLGPILRVYADKAGLVLTNADGDQPGVILNLYRFVRGIGCRPVLAGNIKGLHDPYRTPATQAGFARKWGQNPRMVTSFADGTKISFEQAVVANATGMSVARRGMLGPTCEAGTPIETASKFFTDKGSNIFGHSGIVDYVVGAAPAPGIFILAEQRDEVQRKYLELYKMGSGPIFCFHTPCHLCHFEVPTTVARAVLFQDAAVSCAGPPRVGVVAAAKTDLCAGEILDGPGGFSVYGLAENSPLIRKEGLLPIGLSQGCRLLRPVRKDEVLKRDDVTFPEGLLSLRLEREQDERFPVD